MDISSLYVSATEFEATLNVLYDKQLPLIAQFTNLGRAIGGMGALLYISGRLYAHMARNEAIDFFPLLRPFAIGLCILLFPELCSGLRGITLAVSHSVDGIRQTQQAEIDNLNEQKKAALKKSPQNEDFATDEAMEAKLKNLGGTTGLSNLGAQTSLRFKRIQYEVGENFREWMKNALELGALGAHLLISLISTLFLIVLSVAGPICFGLAIFPGFGGGVAKWFGHFITISFWLPVSTIFSSVLGHIQIMMLNNDITRIQAQGNLETADIGYMCFLILSIGAYLFVPKAADMLVAAAGGGVAPAAAGFMQGATGAAGVAGAATGAGIAGAAQGLGATVGAAQGLAGAATPGNMTRGESLGYQAGSAVRERISRLRG